MMVTIYVVLTAYLFACHAPPRIAFALRDAITPFQVRVRARHAGAERSVAAWRSSQFETLVQWFNTSCFADVPKGVVRPGNSTRYPIRGPGFQKWDISTFKNFPVTDRLRLQFRAEFFNIFNHTNFQGGCKRSECFALAWPGPIAERQPGVQQGKGATTIASAP